MPRKFLEDIAAREIAIKLLSGIISAEHKNISAVLYPALTDGSIVGHLLADKMKVKTKAPLHVSPSKRTLTLRPVDLEMLSGKTCLYVDDVITTGDGLKIVADTLIQNNINLICIATLFIRDLKKFNELVPFFNVRNISLKSIFVANLSASTKMILSSTPVEKIN